MEMRKHTLVLGLALALGASGTGVTPEDHESHH